MRLRRSEPAELIVRANSTCFSLRLPCALSASSLDRISSELSGVRSSWLHVGEELGLVLRRQRELLGLFLERAPRHFDFDILRFDLLLLVLEELRLLLKLLVGRVQLLLLAGELGLPRLKLLGQQLRLLEQALGAHGRGDRVEHDADRFHQLVEEVLVGLVELVERGELDHRLHFVLEQCRAGC